MEIVKVFKDWTLVSAFDHLYENNFRDALLHPLKDDDAFKHISNLAIENADLKEQLKHLQDDFDQNEEENSDWEDTWEKEVAKVEGLEAQITKIKDVLKETEK